MKTTISVRHTEIADDLRARAEAVMEKVGQLSPHALDSTVIFDQSPSAHIVEIRVHVRRGQILVGQAEEADHRTALDRAEDKVRRQIVDRNGTDARRRSGRASRP
jgi:ribosomal subunit interface protein